MNTHEHIDELAELYALGALDDVERATVDAHVESCALCAARLAQAEQTIAETIEEREPPSTLDVRVRKAFTPQRAPAPRWGSLVAAAFLVGLLPGLLFAVLYRPSAPYQADRDRAITAMVTNHFLHAQFIPVAAGAPKAKVIYGRGKPWRFFVAETNHPYTVRAERRNGTSVLGALHVNGNSAELFIPYSNAKSFTLLDGTQVVARVRLP